MVESARAYDVDARRTRAERILDAAAELLERWGYKRLTMDDVAQHVGIGKGTLYLHWKTREALFGAVLQRELSSLMVEFLAGIRADPREALPHRLSRMYFLGIMRRPLLRAFFTDDLAMLGKLASGARGRNPAAPQLDVVRLDYARLLIEQRVLRGDVSPEEVAYVYRGILLGFVLSEPLDINEPSQLTLDRKADLLMGVVERALDLDRRASAATLQVIAAQANELFTLVANNLGAELRQAYE
ncbi:MAG TPA: helix-turn-helix domain-containing protein [Chloroflexota bacterium]|nr:helix-turn-helix domain-containing protein [Chloroflexota bacterium]